MDQTTSNKVYEMDLKIFEEVPADTIPFDISECLRPLTNSTKLGYHTIVRHWSEEMFDEFVDFCNAHEAVIKFIGHHVIG